MEQNESFRFIDEDSTEQFSYVWKKKKAIQKTKVKTTEEKDFRQLCADSCKDDGSSFDESYSESATYFKKEGSSSGDDIPDVIDEDEDFSNNDTSLSPRAPLVPEEEEEEEEDYFKEKTVDQDNLEIIVHESDHERIALTTRLTVKEQEEVLVKPPEMEAETIIKHLNAGTNERPDKSGDEAVTSRRVHFKEDQDHNRKCDKKEYVPPLNEEGSEIDLLFTEDVTIRVSFKEGKVIVEESERKEGNNTAGLSSVDEDAPSDSISRLTREMNKGDSKEQLNLEDRGENGIFETEFLKEEENVCLQRQREDAYFPFNDNNESHNANEKENIMQKVSDDETNNSDKNILVENNIMDSLEKPSVLDLEGYHSRFVEGAEEIVKDKCQEKTKESTTITENSKLEHDFQTSEKCSTSEIEDNLSPVLLPARGGLEGNSYESSDTESDFNMSNYFVYLKEGEIEDSKDDLLHSTRNYGLTSNEYYNSNNLFSLHDIIEEESCSDIDNEDYTSSDSTVFFEAVENFDSKANLNVVSNDESLQNYTKTNNQSEDSSNSDSSLEKCEIESSEKETMKSKSNPVLNLLEMQEKEEIYESSLEILQEFRSNLIPGITSASNWISCCDSEELSLGVVGGGGNDGEGKGGGQCGRWTALSTSDAEAGGNSGADMLSTYPSAPGHHAWQYTVSSDSDSDSDSESVQGDSLDTVIRVPSDSEEPRCVDREVQVDSQCERCESYSQDHGGPRQTSCDKEVAVSGEVDLLSFVNSDCSTEENRESSFVPLDSLESEPDSVNDSKGNESEISPNDCEPFTESERKNDTNVLINEDSEEVEKQSENSESPKVLLKDLFPIKRTTNALENLPLIFPHARGLTVTKPVNKFQNLIFKSPFEKDNRDTPSDQNAVKERKEAENQELEKKTLSFPGVGDLCGRVDVKTDSLFQFNVHTHEGVTSFSEEVRDSSEDDMKQKKKPEDNRSQGEAVGASNSEMCNGYHRGVLKSALKRTSTKKSKKKNRVQFDESLNKFFDADYVILIREEPDDLEGDYDPGGCDCGEDFCYDDCCDEDDEEPPSPRFDLCAAFEPPVEFVDQVTLSPPDGYKDTSHYCPHHHPRLAKRTPDGREDWLQAETEDNHSRSRGVADTRSEATNTDDDLNLGLSDQSHNVTTGLELSLAQQHQQKQPMQQQQQQQRYIVETITMTTVTERRIVREAEDQRLREPEEKLSGILKGGKLWKSLDSENQTDMDNFPRRGEDVTQVTGEEDDRRGVRFLEGAAKSETKVSEIDESEKNQDGSELNLPLKVASSMLCTSKPNSAVRQLFPGQRFMSPPPMMARSPETEYAQEDQNKYLVTAENLKMFEEAKKSKLQQYYSAKTNSKDGSSQTVSSPHQEHPPSDDDEGLSSSLIKRTIERNTLRRSLLKYPHDIRLKRNQNKLKNENSLVERIKQLTCDVDDDADGKGKDGDTRTSPSGEESHRDQGPNHNRPDKIASSGMSSTYKKLTDLFSRRDKLEAAHPSVILQTPVSVERQYAYYQPVYHQQSTPPDLGNGLNTPQGVNQKHLLQQRNSVTTEARKQFLSSLAPLTACVSGNLDDSPGSRENQPLPGDRMSVASTSTAQDSEYSLDDIEEVLNSDDTKSQPQPDVVAGTPAGNSDQDELALFVQQDAGRIERIRKRYSSTPNSAGSDDDEHDDYGFNRRPSVRGIKPRFGSTTEILQQMQSQLQPPPLACPNRVGSHITWPYYTPDDRRNTPNRTAMPILKEETHFTYIPDPNMEFAANSPVDPSRTYQHQMIYSSSGNLHQPMRIGGGGDIQYPARVHHIHSDSPPRLPPMAMMVPFQEHDFPYRATAPIYARRAIPGSVVQMRVSPIPSGSAVRLPLPPYVEPEPHYSTQPLPPGTTSIIRVGQQQTIRVPYPTGGPVQVHLLATRRSESPQRVSPQQPAFPANHYVVARGTQTSSISSTYYNIGNTVPPRGTYYPSPALPQSNGPNYNRGPLIYSEHPPKPPHLYNNNNYPSNPHRATSPIQSLTSSPTRMKPQHERGVPEGAASSSPAFPQDSVYQLQVSSGTNIPSPGSETTLPPATCDSATSPVTPPQTTAPSSVYYSMNV